MTGWFGVVATMLSMAIGYTSTWITDWSQSGSVPTGIPEAHTV